MKRALHDSQSAQLGTSVFESVDVVGACLRLFHRGKIALRLEFLFLANSSRRIAFLLGYPPADHNRLGHSCRRVRALERRAVVCFGGEKPATAGSLGLHLRGGHGGWIPLPPG